MSKKSKNIVALILAAGESKRLGKPKQNLLFRSKTLLNNIKEHLSADIVDRTFIVLGAYAKEIQESSGLEASEIIYFKGWKEGMGSSLAYACSEIFRENKYSGILITLSDLPFEEKEDYQKMIKEFKTPNDIVATKAGDSLGVPAIFGSAYFKELQKLKGEKGAKILIYRYKDRVVVCENERAGLDIDTIDDYEKLGIVE